MIANRYREIGQLGPKGVCGQSLRCFDVNEQCEVAVKLIETHGGLVGPWDEARYLRQLSDPHILPIRNALEDLGQPILVTEIAEGGTTGDRLGQPVGLAPLEAIDWVRQACLGVARAHSEGLIHNDIKPANLFLTNTGRCMVGDFGFATLIDPSVGRARLLGTTATTGAPEAITGALTGKLTAYAPSDVYSLGATLYWLLVGTPPVPATKTHQQARDFVERGQVVALKWAAPHVVDYTCRVVARALSPDPDKRQQTVVDLHSDLGSARAAEGTGRQWHRIAPHAGHTECWECSPVGDKKGLQLCLVPTGNSKYDIQVIYTGSRRKYQSTKTTNVRAIRDLRKMFKQV